MQTRYEHNGLTWIDLESPTRAEALDAATTFGIDALDAQELLLPSAKARIEPRGSYLYLILHFPALHHSHRGIEQEIDFIIGREFIVTTRYDTVDPLHKFSKVFEVDSLLDKSDLGAHAGFIFFYMIRKLYGSVEHELEYVRRDLATIEERIFSGDEVAMVASISRAARQLLNLRQVIEPHREVLREFEAAAPVFFGREFEPYVRSLLDEYYRAHNHIMRQTESLHELRETNNSLLTTKQNETMKALTLMALITFPLALIAGIFSMNTIGTPVVDRPGAFWYVLGLMVLTAAVMFAYFRHKKWL